MNWLEWFHKGFNRVFVRLFIRDADMIWYLIKRKKIKKLRSFLWARLFVRDIGGGLSDLFYRHFPVIAPYPKEIEVEVTTRCHLKCILCEHTYWKDESYRKRDLSFDDFVKICNQFLKLRFINVTGEGTCFLNKDFMKILEYLSNRGVYTLFVESFDLFDEPLIRKVVELGVERIEVSVDAAKKGTYEKIKIGAKWDVMVNNLKILREVKKEFGSPFPYVFFRYVITTLNINEMEDFLDFVKDIDVNLGRTTDVEFAGLLTFKEIEQYDVNSLDDNQVKRIEEKAKSNNIYVAWPPAARRKTQCMQTPMIECAKWRQPYIMIGGDVVIDCAVLMSNNRETLIKTRLGNVLEEGFHKIWHSERYKAIRKSVNKKEGAISLLCKGCRGYDTTEREREYGVF